MPGEWGSWNPGVEQESPSWPGLGWTHWVCAVGTPLGSLVGWGGSGAAPGSPVGSPAPGHGMTVPIRRGRRSVRQPASSDWSALTASGGQIPAQGRLPRPSLAASLCLRGLQTPAPPSLVLVWGPRSPPSFSLLLPHPGQVGPLGCWAGIWQQSRGGLGVAAMGREGTPSPDGGDSVLPSLPQPQPLVAAQSFQQEMSSSPRLSQGGGCGPPPSPRPSGPAQDRGPRRPGCSFKDGQVGSPQCLPQGTASLELAEGEVRSLWANCTGS